MKYALSAEFIGTVRQVSIEQLPGFLMKIFVKKFQPAVFRGDGINWYYYPSGKRVEGNMVTFINNVWNDLDPKEG